MENPLRILVDTGSNKNFIHPKFAKISHNVNNPFYVSSVGGDIKIERFSQGKIFAPYSDVKVKLFHMPKLKSFDAIIGHDTLKEIKAVIDTSNEKLIIDSKYEIPLMQHKLQMINQIHIRDEHLPQNEKEKNS